MRHAYPTLLVIRLGQRVMSRAMPASPCPRGVASPQRREQRHRQLIRHTRPPTYPRLQPQDWQAAFPSRLDAVETPCLPKHMTSRSKTGASSSGPLSRPLPSCRCLPSQGGSLQGGSRARPWPQMTGSSASPSSAPRLTASCQAHSDPPRDRYGSGRCTACLWRVSAPDGWCLASVSLELVSFIHST